MRTRLRAGENVAAVVRRHWIVLVAPFGVALFLLGGLTASAFVRRPGVVPAAAALLAAAAAWAGWRWLDWRFDLWAVTSQRVIDEQGILAVRMVDSPLDTIHNVTCEQSFWGRVLGYGTLNLQTGAEHGLTTIESVGSPQELRATILEMKERYKEGMMARQAAPLIAALGGGAAAGGHGAGAGLSWAGGAGAVAAGSGAAGAADSKECPYCAEKIKARATVCRFCGRTL
jgi:membrane protein YdbS with pleckstrin-like domain